MRIFITGTDTDIGKTIVSSLICMRTNWNYWKPIQTGIDSDSQTIKTLSPQTEIIPEVYKLKQPLSPFDSANFEDIAIDKNKFSAISKTLPEDLVIEGAGGVLVPIAEDFLMIDLIKILASQVIIVAKSKLGFLNHIFLTVEALQARNIPIIGIVINGEIDNVLVKTIELFTKVTVLKIIPTCIDIKTSLKNISFPIEVLK